LIIFRKYATSRSSNSLSGSQRKKLDQSGVLAFHLTINSVHLRFDYIEYSQIAYDVISTLAQKSNKLKALCFLPTNETPRVSLLLSSLEFIGCLVDQRTLGKFATDSITFDHQALFVLCKCAVDVVAAQGGD
jgi:hypothetical protein